MLTATFSGIKRVFPRHLVRQVSRMHSVVYAVPRVSRRGVDDEVVEDSEPEREALRQIQKQERKKRKLAAMGIPDAAALNDSIPTQVIIISDGSVPASPIAASAAPRQNPPSPIPVIEISDSSMSMNENIISLHSSASGINPYNTALNSGELATVSLHEDVAPPLASHSDSQHSDDEELVPTLNLTRFSFPNPRPLQPRNSASTVDSASNSDTQTKPLARRASSSSKGLAGDFSDTELRKLVKCVSCDIAWTARKSAAQKMVHIRSCAKKTGLTDDTVRFLIRKELDNAPDEPGPSKRNGKAPEVLTTLLEDVVREAGPKRRGKRKAVADTLKSAAETRENIRNRVQMVLGSGSFSDGDSFIAQTQAVMAVTAQEPCATQAFGPSRLGQQQGYKSLILGEQDSDGEPDLPPATQPFAPSKFGGRTTSGGWGYESESEDESFPRVSSPKRSNNPPLFSAKEVSPTSSPRMRKNTIAMAAAPPSPAMQSDRGSDDAYVHFDPELNEESFLEPLNLIQKPNKNLTPTREKQTKPIQAEGGKSPKAIRRKIRVPTDVSESPRPSTPKAKPKKSRKKAQDQFDETWELELKEKILEDRELHLRILRYEPINFDIFLKLATDEEVVGGRLKLKLRAFLDKQAINFYGGENNGRTRRR